MRFEFRHSMFKVSASSYFAIKMSSENNKVDFEKIISRVEGLESHNQSMVLRYTDLEGRLATLQAENSN